MEGIITLIIIGFILTFGSQLLKGIGNIFAASGRVGGWILGIILVLFLLKTIVFSPKPAEPGSLSHAKEVFGGEVSKEGEFFIDVDGDKYKWNDTEEDYEWVQ
jgi:hypothetical protein